MQSYCESFQKGLKMLEAHQQEMKFYIEEYAKDGDETWVIGMERVKKSYLLIYSELNKDIFNTPQEEAAEIMGDHYVGPGPVGSVFGTEVEFGRIPFSRHELFEAKEKGAVLIYRDATDSWGDALTPSMQVEKMIAYKSRSGPRKYAEHIQVDMQVLQRLINVASPAVKQVQDEHPRSGWALVNIAETASLPVDKQVPSLSEMLYDLLVSDVVYSALKKDDFVFTSSKIVQGSGKFIALRLKEGSPSTPDRLDIISKSDPETAAWTYYQDFRRYAA